ncbi:choice-of-anchor I family protein [Endozoicomonadaceae bacterium StTr2]
MQFKSGLISAAVLGASMALTGCAVQPDASIQKNNAATMTLVGRHASNIYFDGAAEIVSWHPRSQSVLVVNSGKNAVDILDISHLEGKPLLNPRVASNIPLKSRINVSKDIPELTLGAANSVAVKGDLLAVAVENKNKQQPGIVAFYQLQAEGEAQFSNYVTVGALPDMVTFTPDGRYVMAANEGEPSDDYLNDPEGSISLISVVDQKRGGDVRMIRFDDFNKSGRRHNELPEAVRVFGPGASVAQDLEPEYIAVAPAGNKAFVSLQENNAVAVIDIATASVDKIVALGFKDFGASAIDASNKDGGVNIKPWSGVYGMYQPDTLVAYETEGKTYFVTANEGDARDYKGFSEEKRAGKIKVAKSHPNKSSVKDKKELGRLKVTTAMGDENNDGRYEKLFSFGGRSFSIWDENGKQVFDSGSDFERITAARLGANFNNNDDASKGDSRSDDKGPEPEALAIGQVRDRTYAFVGLERTGGIMMYDITVPEQAFFVDYVHNRSFDVDVSKHPEMGGDLSPEGMTVIAASDSPTGKPLLVVGNEVSGSTAVYQLD